MNQVTLYGNLGNDPELKYSQNGTAVCSFRLATSETWTDSKKVKQTKTEWHRIVVFGKLAENVAEFLTKGRRVLINGKIQTRDYTDKDGNKRFSTEILGLNVDFGPRQGAGAKTSVNAQESDFGYTEDQEENQMNLDSDLPF